MLHEVTDHRIARPPGVAPTWTEQAVTVGAMGLFFAAVYVWRGSLAAPIVMHFLQDFISVVVAPLLVRQ